jgi:hypothetical protein
LRWWKRDFSLSFFQIFILAFHVKGKREMNEKEARTRRILRDISKIKIQIEYFFEIPLK